MKQDNLNKSLTAKQLSDVRSPEVCLILFIYSMEPPIYQETYKACRTCDKTKLYTLGPYAKALCEVLRLSKQLELSRICKIEAGINLGRSHVYGEGMVSFLIYRGV